jgi:hypothetical protein
MAYVVELSLYTFADAGERVFSFLFLGRQALGTFMVAEEIRTPDNSLTQEEKHIISSHPTTSSDQSHIYRRKQVNLADTATTALWLQSSMYDTVALVRAHAYHCLMHSAPILHVCMTFVQLAPP